MAAKEYAYTFKCPCGNKINRNYVAHGSSLTCKKCGKRGEIIKFDYHVRVCWLPDTKE